MGPTLLLTTIVNSGQNIKKKAHYVMALESDKNRQKLEEI